MGGWHHLRRGELGTSALHLGMLAAGIGPGDQVIVPSFTFAATANSVALTGATPVFVDIDPVTFCIDPKAVGRRSPPIAGCGAGSPVRPPRRHDDVDAGCARTRAHDHRGRRSGPRCTVGRQGSGFFRNRGRVLVLSDEEHDIR